MKPTTLIDSALQSDPLADQEMGAPVPREDGSLPERIAESDIRDCRMLLTLIETEPLKLSNVAGGAVGFECSFQPAAGLRFLNARLTLTLEAPQGIRIVDLAPTEVHGGAVSVTRNRGGQFEVKGPFMAAQLQNERGVQYLDYHCLVYGSGSGTPLARWDFVEDPDRQGGLAKRHALFLTLAAQGSIHGRATLSGEVERPGLLGVGDRLTRWFRLEASPQGPHQPFQFEIPTGP
jgi:hypothetical protein